MTVACELQSIIYFEMSCKSGCLWLIYSLQHFLSWSIRQNCFKSPAWYLLSSLKIIFWSIFHILIHFLMFESTHEKPDFQEIALWIAYQTGQDFTYWLQNSVLDFAKCIRQSNMIKKLGINSQHCIKVFKLMLLRWCPRPISGPHNWRASQSKAIYKAPIWVTLRISFLWCILSIFSKYLKISSLKSEMFYGMRNEMNMLVHINYMTYNVMFAPLVN